MGVDAPVLVLTVAVSKREIATGSIRHRMTNGSLVPACLPTPEIAPSEVTRYATVVRHRVERQQRVKRLQLSV